MSVRPDREGNPDKVVYDAEDIMEMAAARKLRFAERDELYISMLKYYFHGNDTDGGGGSHQVMAMDAKGRPLQRDLGVSNQMNHRVYANKAAAVVDDYQALLGRKPQVRFLPPDGSPQSQLKVTKLDRYMLDTYDMSDMDFQQAECGFFLPTLGDACYVLEPYFPPELREKKIGRVGISALGPNFGYPSFLKGFRRFQLRDLIIFMLDDPEVIEEEYGIKVKKKDDMVPIVTYLSRWQRTVVVGDQQVAHVEHDLGFVPAEWMHNKMVRSNLGMHQFANSEIRNVRALQDRQNYAMAVQDDALLYATYPMIHGKNLDAFSGGQLEVGAGAVNFSNVEGELSILGSTANPAAAGDIIHGTTQDIYTAAGTSSVRAEGDQHSSIQTGRSIHAAQGPQATRLDLKQSLLGYGIERLNQKVLMMQERVPSLAHPFEIHGREKGQEFREEFDPKADIDGWYQNRVSWDAMIGMNTQQKTVVAMQGMAGKIWDQIYAMELVGIEDPVRMRERIQEGEADEMARQAQIQQGAQSQGQPGQGMQAAPHVPGVKLPGGGGAKGGGGAPQSMPFRPPSMSQPGPQGGVPQGVALDAIQNALHAVALKLKGTVFAVGDLATMGQSMTPKLMITNFRDHEPITTAVTHIAPNIKIEAKSEEAMPDQKVRVA